MKRVSIVVAGAQGTGKSTIAHAISRALSAQGVSTTVIEEGLVDPCPPLLVPRGLAKELEVQVLTLQTPRVCRGCGCSDDFACPGGCAWVEAPTDKKPGLCSRCAAPAQSKRRANR